MQKFNKKCLKWSLLVCIMLTLIIPSNVASDNDWWGSYYFGFPLEYITIYQHEPYSSWLFSNVFNGNSGMHFNIGGLLLNILIIFLVLQFLLKRFVQKDQNKFEEGFSNEINQTINR
ncbi:hypothetical protein [Gracilibacillus salitolerans]|uniref:hypothetical protein n=1 Tax=Gracilibacillus salitolerans TaxID=2663022 RepID=UPI0018918A30|nr:hypothetical protein [Gracilibacillus salitolerans]